MARYQPLDSEKHRAHGWKRFDSLAHTAGQICAPVVLAELPALLPHYALAFARDAQGAFRPVAVQGLYRDENLLVTDTGKWLLPYVPSIYRAHPFALHGMGEGEARRSVLCFDLDSGLYRESPESVLRERRFFEDDGSPSDELGKLLQFLQQRQANDRQTQRAVDALAAAELLQPAQWQLQSPDPERELARGWFSVDEKRLAAISGDTLEQLHQTGALMLAHAQLLSRPRLATLQKLAERRLALAAVGEVEDLDELFGGKDDTLQFNF